MIKAFYIFLVGAFVINTAALFEYVTLFEGWLLVLAWGVIMTVAFTTKRKHVKNHQ